MEKEQKEVLEDLNGHLLEEIHPKELTLQSYALCQELINKAKLKKGQILLVGCSSSEVIGERIGSCSSMDVAACLFQGSRCFSRHSML